ncbi:hypothetical protein MNB_SV-14-1156 [hydrothermal vent metagenome]|uniref:Outer membrane protein beta-barrel domain-containing protein n=1 Tax=hydrothermal vent metagenome TaxID=652676 RepID=A0A1W1CGL6_9ZZZZ
MKKLLGAICCITLLAINQLNASSSMADELKEASAGSVSSRFRVGYFGGIGYQGRIGGEADTKIQGLLLEGGVYGLFNPIKNFLDFEVGLSGKYNTGMNSSSSNSGKTTYYAGLKQVTVYGGTVFRFGNTKKALAVGVSKALTISEVQSDESKSAGIQKNDLENGIGTYIEYQSGDTSIFFTRVEVEKIDVVSSTETNKDTVASILFGMKF